MSDTEKRKPGRPYKFGQKHKVTINFGEEYRGLIEQARLFTGDDMAGFVRRASVAEARKVLKRFAA